MRENLLGLCGKPALVAGGGFGIGRATASLLADAGATVAVADIDRNRAEGVCDEITKQGGRAFPIAGDVLSMKGAESIVAQAADLQGGNLEVVINIVGSAWWGSLLDVDTEAWHREFVRNLDHHWYIGRAAARTMIEKETGGRIALLASVSGLYGSPFHAAYGAAKAGVMALGRSMAQEWAQYGIRVNTVCPDMIATPKVMKTFQRLGEDPDTVARREDLPLGRFGLPEEIAGALVFLVSDLSSFITGQNLVVDGGVIAAFPHPTVADVAALTSKGPSPG